MNTMMKYLILDTDTGSDYYSVVDEAEELSDAQQIAQELKVGYFSGHLIIAEIKEVIECA